MPTNFYARYKEQMTKLISNPFPLVDSTGAHLASQELNTAWCTKRYEVSDSLLSDQAQKFKSELCKAPFGWDHPMHTGLMMGASDAQ